MADTTLAGRWHSCAPYVRSVLRIVAAFAFFTYGSAKLFAWPMSMMGNGATAHFGTMMGTAGLLEVGGGVLMFVGLFSRPVAFVLSGEMAYAYLTSHIVRSWWPVQNQGTPALLFCFIWLYISAAGPGPLSLDAILRHTEKK